MKKVSRFVGGFVLAAGLLAGCMTNPPSNIHQPMTVRPAPVPAQAANNGAVFYAGARPLFEDRRARNVGDTLTINLVENTQASKSSNSAASKDGADSLNSSVSGMPLKFLNGVSVGIKDSNTFSGKGTSAANNVFTGTITVTVIEVYPNGNLLVSGEKQIAINQGDEYIRFSGVVNPVYVSSSNVVQSIQVADARLEYKARGYIDEAQTMGWLQRFFMNVLPF
ncbi:flagellar basal body L-ring protein FlgH [Uliginosibacterium gangwonense]|uniref:flagellar basal body L-ring protein FlgH n=1 Tax=Uliginosibacterium gangwonense TaxID=392736 RepID=UPI00035D825B|nr:flagellar basal body L-ring protein FlgH [Uliginosibacterium gangwonense]